MSSLGPIDGLSIIDVDAHITEPYDLWTSRTSGSLRDRLPHVEENDGQRFWVVDGVPISPAIASSVIATDGTKSKALEFFGWTLDDVHPASYDMRERVRQLDEFGIWAQVIYPNVAGFGSQRFTEVEDRELRNACATIYNDAMAEVQADTSERILPMALMPWWNIEDSIAEVERCADMGLRGIVMCSDPDSIGLPDLGEEAWLPFWEICADKKMPVNFHIGASETSFNMYGRAPWPSMNDRQKLALGSAYLFLENSRVLSNMLYSGILERYPDLKVVSVESGIGWIPFMLEAIDYEWGETSSHEQSILKMPPSEYFRRQVYGCFWFEKSGPKKLIEAVGEDNILFETDYPHPTCLYPDVQEYLADVTADWTETQRRKVLQDNAAELYRVKLPS